VASKDPGTSLDMGFYVKYEQDNRLPLGTDCKNEPVRGSTLKTAAAVAAHVGWRSQSTGIVDWAGHERHCGLHAILFQAIGRETPPSALRRCLSSIGIDVDTLGDGKGLETNFPGMDLYELHECMALANQAAVVIEIDATGRFQSIAKVGTISPIGSVIVFQNSEGMGHYVTVAQQSQQTALLTPVAVPMCSASLLKLFSVLVQNDTPNGLNSATDELYIADLTKDYSSVASVHIKYQDQYFVDFMEHTCTWTDCNWAVYNRLSNTEKTLYFRCNVIRTLNWPSISLA
jgi:hypothetical protein